ncbi:MAG: STAS domain-containing protein [Pseudomonadota bacterium]
MNLKSSVSDDAMVITVEADRIDAAVAIRFKDLFRDAAQGAAQRVILDLSRVQFIDSSGLGAVVAAMKLLDREKTLELAGLTPTVAKVFRLTRMDSVFKIHGSLDEAGLVAG